MVGRFDLGEAGGELRAVQVQHAGDVAAFVAAV
jgi:hypothetical protein